MIKFGFSEVDADMNLVEMGLAALGGIGLILGPVILKVVLLAIGA